MCTAVHRCLYLKHRQTNHIITSQYKAWNDSVRMAMWIDLVMAPIKQMRGKMLIWADNCGPHKTDAVKAVFSSWGIHTAFLPPNMTGMLQVLDLVVNGPIKAYIRNIRARRIVEAFALFRSAYAQEMLKAPGERQRLKFKPPKPSYQQAMTDLFTLFATSFSQESFKEGIIRSFIDTGTQPPPSSPPLLVGSVPRPAFKEYKAEDCSGTIRDSHRALRHPISH